MARPLTDAETALFDWVTSKSFTLIDGWKTLARYADDNAAQMERDGDTRGAEMVRAGGQTWRAYVRQFKALMKALYEEQENGDDNEQG